MSAAIMQSKNFFMSYLFLGDYLEFESCKVAASLRDSTVEQFLAMPSALPLRSHCSLISALASPTADEQFAMPSAFESLKETMPVLFFSFARV